MNIEEERTRANYWRQRAKSAEGHLFASDCEAAAIALHKLTRGQRDADFSKCESQYRYSVINAAFVVIREVNSRRDCRIPWINPA
jgi:hypothetical protein